jgi:hypothetical protein
VGGADAESRARIATRPFNSTVTARLSSIRSGSRGRFFLEKPAVIRIEDQACRRRIGCREQVVHSGKASLHVQRQPHSPVTRLDHEARVGFADPESVRRGQFAMAQNFIRRHQRRARKSQAPTARSQDLPTICGRERTGVAIELYAVERIPQRIGIGHLHQGVQFGQEVCRLVAPISR